MPPMMLLREMRVYAVQPNQDGLVQQVRTPQMVPMATPQIKGIIVLKVNLGRGDSLREEDTITDEDGDDDREDKCSESDLPEHSVMPKSKPQGETQKLPEQAEIRYQKRLKLSFQPS